MSIFKFKLFDNEPEKTAEQPTDTDQKKKKPEKSLKFSAGEIYRVMNRTGWGAYEAYVRMLDMLELFKVSTGEEIVRDALWDDYRIRDAEHLVSTGSYLSSLSDPGMSEKEFRRLFYRKKQRAAIKALQKGHLTLGQLADFLRIELPESLLPNIDEDVSGRIATAYRIRKNDIFLCTGKKYVLPDTVKSKSPLCIIGPREFEESFRDTGIPFIPCAYLRSKVLDLSEIWCSRFPAKVLTVSGSIGKTTTTEMIALVAGQNTNMFRKEGNQNTTWQISSFVYDLKPEHEVYVQECSGSYPGQLESSSRMIHPDVFVLTNIGQGHIGKYGGRQEYLLYEKVSMHRQAADGATGIINLDDPLLSRIQYKHRVLTYSMNDSSADFYSDNIKEQDGTISFDVVEKGYGRTPVILNVCGRHNVYNALSAFAAGVVLGIDRDAIVRSLACFRTKGLRQNLTYIGGRHLYLDCYSATVESMEIGMRTLETISVPEGGRKIACLGDIPALEDTEAGHRTVGRMVADVNTADLTIFYGEDMRFAYEEASERGVNCLHITQRKDIVDYLINNTDERDLVMFKASHKVAFQWVLDDLFGTAFYPHDELANGSPVYTEDGIKYRCVEEYGACAAIEDMTIEELTLPSCCRDYPVRVYAGKNLSGISSAEESSLRKIVLQPPLMGIEDYAFRNLTGLEEVIFPDTMKYIGAGAFSGCTGLSAVELTGCTTIDSMAFAGCTGLKKVMLPASLKTISDDAFDPDTDAAFECPQGSYACEWAKGKGYKVISA